MFLARESGGGAAAGCGAAWLPSLRGDVVLPPGMRGELGFGDMEVLCAVCLVDALGAAVDLLVKHLSIPSRSVINGVND